MKRLITYCKPILFALILFPLVSLNSIAATYVVTNTNDSGAGSLRQAIINANASCTLDKINFAISGPAITEIDDRGTASPADDIYYAYYSIQPHSALPDITCPILIDGFTQNSDGNVRTPGTHSIEISGEFFKSMSSTDINNLPPSSVAGLRFIGMDTAGNKQSHNPDGSTIRGLVINKFPHQGIYLYGVDNMTIISNYLATDITGEKSGYQVGYAVSNIEPFPAYDTLRVEGSNNNFIGTVKADYIKNSINPLNRNLLGEDGAVTFENLNQNITGIGNCAPVSCQRLDLGSSNNVVQNNLFGLNKDGMRLINNNSGGGVFIGDSANNRDNIIGGLKKGQGNVISGPGPQSIILQSGTNTQILGNLIGTDITGENILGAPATFCIAFFISPVDPAPSTGTLIKGNTVKGCGTVPIFMFQGKNTLITNNTISNNGDLAPFTFGLPFGVALFAALPDVSNTAILSNSMHDNGFGIDLGPFPSNLYVTANDLGDIDTGPNDIQNFPVLQKISFNPAVMFISASLNSTPNNNFIIEFFSSPKAGAFDHGEGKVLIGSKVVTTDPSGNVTINFSYNKSQNALEFNNTGSTFITMTATQKVCEPDGNPKSCKYGSTSEFSKVCEITQTQIANKSTVVCPP